MARRRKADQLNITALVLGPVDARKLEGSQPGEELLSHDAMPGLPIEERFVELGNRIIDRLAGVRDSIGKDESKAVAEFMPWLHKRRPDAMVVELEQRLHLNERVIAHLMHELGIHIALSAKIEAHLKLAREKALAELVKVPQGLQDFVTKLHASGLLTSSVKDMSKGSIVALVAALNGESDQKLLADLGIGKGSRRVSDEEAEAALETSRRLLEEHRSTALAIVEEPGLPMVIDIEPVVPTEFEEPWDYASGPLPREYWSTVQQLAIPYRWEYRHATPEEEIGVVDMMLPEAHDWASLRSWNRHFEGMAMEVMRTRKTGIRSVRELIGNERGIAPDEVDANLVKTWLLLLVGRLMSAEDCEKMFDPDFFEGLVMPCPATGGSVVRELVRMEG